MSSNKMGNRLVTGVLATLLLVLPVFGRTETLDEKIKQDPELSEFYRLLTKDPIANVTLQIREATLFAPTNQAFQSYQEVDNYTPLLYHIHSRAVSLSELQGSLSTEVSGNPPIFITRVPNNTLPHDELYVNNAKIDRENSNWSGTNAVGQQILHKIDAVLEPLRPIKGAHIFNPDPVYFLKNAENYALGGYNVKSFYQQIIRNMKEPQFTTDIPSTFFIPVDDTRTRFDKIDGNVIDGHIIPNHVLFTRPTPAGKKYGTQTLENPYVTIQLVTETDRGVQTTYVKSTTSRSKDHKSREDVRYPEGVVIAEIVRPNIPVRRGVVHLIDRPLMIVEGSTNDFIQGRPNGLLSKFREVLMEQDDDFKRRFQFMENTTVFAPSNEAWSNPIAQRAIHNKTLLKEVLNLHIAHGLLPLRQLEQHHQVRHSNQHNGRHHSSQTHDADHGPLGCDSCSADRAAENVTISFLIINLRTAKTFADDKKLHFNVVTREGIRTLTVDGNGVNATVIHPDIVTTNGIIHVIDRVLGIASHTVGEKVATDPHLSKTYQLGKYDINQRLKEQSNFTRYTYFVPRDAAWDTAEIEFPSAVKKIFMPKYSYFATRILERHLVQSNRVYTIADIKRISSVQREPALLPTPRDVLKIQIKERANAYYIVWKNKEILVQQPDVECTNGIIHILDNVLMTESDIIINGASSFFTPALSHVIMLLAVKWLL